MALPPPTSREQRVYANASLQLSSVRAVGFDMDYTLALYASVAVERLAFEMAVDGLLRMGYPAAVGDLEYRPGLTIRGLVVDKKAGNVLKMDRYHYVSIAAHGATELDAQERRRLYANRSIQLGSRYVSVDTLFHMPEVDLFMQLVALKDAHPDLLGPRSYELLWVELRHALDLCHRDGRLKAAMLEDLDTYLDADPELPAALVELRAAGRKLFLLTNSEHYYTDAVMAHLFDGKHPGHPRWTDYFDEVVVEARKPGYFLGYEDSEVVEEYTDARGVSRQLLRGGNYRELDRRLGCAGDEVLFVGDHIYGDVIRSKTHSFWRTMMVVPELAEELATADELTEEVRAYNRLLEMLEETDRFRAGLRYELLQRGEDAPPGEDEARRLGEADADARRLEGEVDAAEKRLDRCFHPAWGGLFQDGGEISRFGAQVGAYADIYSSRVCNLARYPPDKWFHTPWEVLSHWRRSGER